MSRVVDRFGCFLLLLIVLFLWIVSIPSVTASYGTLSLEQEALHLQHELTSAATPSQEIQTLESQLDFILEQLAATYRQIFRDTPRPAERLDDVTVQTSELTAGRPLWFLMEIPQWWITATVVEVLAQSSDSKEDLLLVRVTSSGETLQVKRGIQVRVVKDSDRVLWDSEQLRDLGEFARTQNLQEDRMRLYLESLQVDPTNPHPMDNLGLYYSQRQQNEEDLAKSKYWLEKSIQANPQWYHAYYNLGLLYRDHDTRSFDPSTNGAAAKALQLFQTAWQLNPLFLDSLWNIAEMLARQGDYHKECYHWRLLRVLNRNPSPHGIGGGEGENRVWNPEWEEFTTNRIQGCMDAINTMRTENSRAEMKEEL